MYMMRVSHGCFIIIKLSYTTNVLCYDDVVIVMAVAATHAAAAHESAALQKASSIIEASRAASLESKFTDDGLSVSNMATSLHTFHHRRHHNMCINRVIKDSKCSVTR
jgi:hypothetical protein